MCSHRFGYPSQRKFKIRTRTVADSTDVEGRPFLYAVDLVNRDKAHASRRCLSRPWQADGLLSEAYDRAVKRGSICHMVTYSPHLAQWLREMEDADSEASVNV